MYMTDGEIITFFKQAKDQAHQISVLADLNGCQKYDMEVKLAELGLVSMPEPKPAPQKSDKMRVDPERAKALYDQGLTDKEMAAELGASAWAVGEWRRSNGIYRSKANTKINDAAAKEMVEAGRTDEEIGKAFGVTAKGVASWRARQGLVHRIGRPKGIDDRTAMKLLWEGKSDQEMAKAMDVRVSAVQAWRSDRGLFRPMGRPRGNKGSMPAPEQPVTVLLKENDLRVPMVFQGVLAGIPFEDHGGNRRKTMLNKIILMGRLTRDPELRRTQSGTAVASFSLAVDRDYKDSNGEKETDFIDCVAWRGTAEFASKYFSKGRMAVVEGRLQIRDWTDKDGNKRRSAEVVVDNMYFADSKKTVSNSDQSEPDEGFQEVSGEDDGELPF